MLFTYEDIAGLLELDPKNEISDRLCFETAYSMIEKYIGYNMEETNHNELHTVIDNRILPDKINIKEVISIIDQNTKQRIEHCVIDYENKTILFLSCKYDGHVFFINYNSGYTAETLPAEIKQAIIEMFLITRNRYLGRANHIEETEENVMPESIKEILRNYTRKCL